MVHLVGFTIEIYYDAWTYKHQIKLKLSLLSHRACCYTLKYTHLTFKNTNMLKHVCKRH
jgi:hypothetical protein